MTPTQRAAMEQALEALENERKRSDGWVSVGEHKAISALRAALVEQPAEQEPVAWEWRWFDANPYTVTSGQWSEWKRVEPRNPLCTLEDALNEFRAYIAQGQRYELRALHIAPQPAIPPGFKMVPVEPTEEMCNPSGEKGPVADMSAGYRKEIWKSMLAAAPNAPQPAKRVPLTDDEIEEINGSLTGRRDLARLFARAIERAHGITGEAAHGIKGETE